jgi:hypothetical protein
VLLLLCLLCIGGNLPILIGAKSSKYCVLLQYRRDCPGTQHIGGTETDPSVNSDKMLKRGGGFVQAGLEQVQVVTQGADMLQTGLILAAGLCVLLG